MMRPMYVLRVDFSSLVIRPPTFIRSSMNAIESETHRLRHFFFSNKGRDSLWFFCFDFPGDQQGSVLNFVDKVDLVWQKSAFPKLVRKAFLIGAFLCAPPALSPDPRIQPDPHTIEG